MTDLWFTNLRLFPCFSNRDSKVAKRIPSSPSSSSSVKSPSSTTRRDSAERPGSTIDFKEPSPSAANCSDSTSHEDDVILDDSSPEEILHKIKPPKTQLSEC